MTVFTQLFNISRGLSVNISIKNFAPCELWAWRIFSTPWRSFPGNGQPNSAFLGRTLSDLPSQLFYLFLRSTCPFIWHYRRCTGTYGRMRLICWWVPREFFEAPLGFSLFPACPSFFDPLGPPRNPPRNVSRYLRRYPPPNFDDKFYNQSRTFRKYGLFEAVWFSLSLSVQILQPST